MRLWFRLRNEESNILYIGKAGSDNFAAEIYSKFSAATEIKEIDGKEVPCLGNSSMAKWAKTAKKDYMEDFRNGDIWISAIHVEPKEFASLLEVYLHVWCATKEELLRWTPLSRQFMRKVKQFY